jgi:hypothetical protein
MVYIIRVAAEDFENRNKTSPDLVLYFRNSGAGLKARERR